MNVNFSFRPLNADATKSFTIVGDSSAELRMEEDCVRPGTVICETFVKLVSWDSSVAASTTFPDKALLWLKPSSSKILTGLLFFDFD